MHAKAVMHASLHVRVEGRSLMLPDHKDCKTWSSRRCKVASRVVATRSWAVVKL